MYTILKKQKLCEGICSAFFFFGFLFFFVPYSLAQESLVQECPAQERPAQSLLSSSSVSLMWYNCENFFDTENDSLKNDEEFLPKGSKHWNRTRYMKKQNQVATLICDIVSPCWPTFVGLCEIENRTVLENLVHYPLKERYGIAHFESEDSRGIDVGLLYKKDEFCLDTAFPKRVELEKHFPTRDILVVLGHLYGRPETLALVALHAPSKRGGALVSEKKRMACLATLKGICDSLTQVTPYVIVMGDFNETIDEPALCWFIQETHFQEMKDPRHFQSYSYKGIWGSIDHVLLSPSFLESHDSSLQAFLTLQSFSIYRPSYLLEWQKSALDSLPRRTYRGPFYLGGFSDHLPLRLILELTP